MKKILLILALSTILPVFASAQGNAFSFQGRLNDGTNPANGAYDLEFRLYPTITGGTPIGNTVVSRPNTALINGVFSVSLDFGATAFNFPNSIFIEIGVRPNGSPNGFTILGPRQQLTVVPFAVRATNATFADNAGHSVVSDVAILAENAGDSLSLGGFPATTFARLNVVNTGDLKATGGLYMDGDIRQFSNSGGAVKAMALIRVTRTPFPEFPAASATVVRCFSGVALPAAPNCGITFGIVDTSDHVQINFGFTVNNRFVSLTATNDTASVIGYPNATTVEVDDTTTNRGSSEFYIYVF